MSASTAGAATPSLVSLQGQSALVTGSASGIGAAVATRLLSHGVRVLGVDRVDDGAGGLRRDLADPAQAAGVVTEAVGRLGGLDLVINNAGLARHSAVADLDMADFDLMAAVNLRAAVQITRDAFRVMAPPSGRGGQIVNVVSTAGLAGEPGEAGYCATKFALRGFTEAAAQEGKLYGIRVHGIYPAGVSTGFWDAAVGDTEAFSGDKQFLSPDDVAVQVLQLLHLPSHVEVPQLVSRHVADAEIDGIRRKLERVRR